MSENGSDHHIEADESEPQPQGQKKPIHFDEEGQPIGPGSTQYVTFIGKMARMHCSPTYIDWHTVPETNKKHVWDAVLEAYDIQVTRKVSVLRKANIAWKSRKYTLRKIYDEYPTNVERRLNILKGIRPEDWESFIEFCSTDDDRIRRAKGKASRAHMKLSHTTGRRGSARTKEELKKQSSNGKVTRTQLFVATHTRPDGTTFPETRPTLDEIKRLVTLDPNLGEYDLDNDAVAMACGPDGKGRVRGVGGCVSKTVIHAAAPYKKIAQQEKRGREESEANFGVVMQRLDEESRARKIVEERLESLERNPSELDTTSQARRRSPALDDESNAVPRSTRCLLNFFKKRNVALGHVRDNITQTTHSYRIRVDDIFDYNA